MEMSRCQWSVRFASVESVYLTIETGVYRRSRWGEIVEGLYGGLSVCGVRMLSGGVIILNKSIDSALLLFV